MGSNDLFDNLGMSRFPSVDADTIAFYAAELIRAIESKDPKEAATVGMNFGIEIGVAMCKDARDAAAEWSEPRTKKAWCTHFGKEDWRTIRDNLRTKKVTERIAQIHVEDLNKRW